MSEPDKRLSDFEDSLADTDNQSKDDALAELRAKKVDVKRFLRRVEETVQESYAEQLRAIAESGQEAEHLRPAFLSGIGEMAREEMAAIFERLRRGDLGASYQEAAVARCRNKDASELSDEELRSWLEDIGETLGDAGN